MVDLINVELLKDEADYLKRLMSDRLNASGIDAGEAERIKSILQKISNSQSNEYIKSKQNDIEAARKMNFQEVMGSMHSETEKKA